MQTVLHSALWLILVCLVSTVLYVLPYLVMCLNWPDHWMVIRITSSHPHTFTSSHPHTLTPSHPHTFTSSHPHTLTPSHPHTLTHIHAHSHRMSATLFVQPLDLVKNRMQLSGKPACTEHGICWAGVKMRCLY